MIMNRNVSKQLFHGTSAALKPGDMITPQAVESRLHKDLRIEGHAFATDSRDAATWYAEQHARKFGGKPVVYHVETPSDVEHHPEIERDTYSSPTGFKVTHGEPVNQDYLKPVSGLIG